ncbi:MAG: hypothetical protein AAF902_10665 [Chloroflexota bacterium]
MPQKNSFSTLSDDLIRSKSKARTYYLPEDIQKLLGKVVFHFEYEVFDDKVHPYQILLASLSVALAEHDPENPTASKLYDELKRIIDLKDSKS